LDYKRWTDDDLVRRFREGDIAAFEALVERYSSPVYNFALRFIGNEPDAADAAQQTFVQLFESPPGSRPDASVRPWLFTVARNKCVDLIRRRIPRAQVGDPTHESTEVDPVDSSPLPEEIYERAEMEQLLQQAIDALPPRNREVVLLRYVGGLTFAEVGEALGMPENTAKTLFQRAKTQLRVFLRQRL
jgi:RNA polymerase sigma-70 factor (ECF subfamily)